MKHSIVSALAIVFLAACSTKEIDFQTTIQNDVVFYASFEQPAVTETKVYANEDLLLRWTADDRVSIFNKNTYNQEYQFIGETGDYEGGFNKVGDPEFITGDAIPDIVSVYPFQRLTRVSADEIITVTLPSEQSYAQNSFGLGANTMVSVSSSNLLKYRNVGGYLMLKLYGEGVSVSSITLKGNNGEKIAGEAFVSMPLDDIPTATMASDATTEISLVCSNPVKLGATEEESMQFWFVVPPVTFSKGFTITVNDSLGGTFEKTTTKSVTIERNILSKMASMEVVPVGGTPKYMTFTSEGTTTISLRNYKGNAPVLYYSTDKVNWILWDYSELTFTNSQPLYLFGDNPEGFSKLLNGNTRYSTFVASGSEFRVAGNIMTLIDNDNAVTTIPSDFCFYRLFYSCERLVSAPELPATTLTTDCYSYMFYGCTSLMTTPELPATTLASGCYSGMFSDCTSLTTAPDLPATTLAKYCCLGMFYGCTSLTTAPELPATTLADACYDTMFCGCTSLTTAPELPATTLPNYCYDAMFGGCASLTSSPELPATTLATDCYRDMFQGCIRLTKAPDLPASTLADDCYSAMFYGCSSLTTAPDLPAITLAKSCYSAMFYGCTSLTTAPDLPATTLAEFCYSEMFSDCTSLTTAPELPATTLADYCYQYMFSGCTSLTTAPELPATTLAKSCYSYMFNRCASLTTAPELPATTLADYCYQYMFEWCSKLNQIKCLATDIAATDCVSYWLNGVASTGTFVKAPGMSDWTKGPSGIPEGWTVIDDSLVSVPEAVDLGLSVKWASFNLGATKPEDYGDYYAWGETEPKEDFYWETYKWCRGSYDTLTKYSNHSEYGYNGYTDDRIVLELEDDAAHYILGGNWRMPTDEEWTELMNNCSSTGTTENGVYGCRFTSVINGNSIFFPAADNWYEDSTPSVGSDGLYWSSSLNTDDPSCASRVYFEPVMWWSDSRCYGQSIRPVYSE